MNKKWLIKQRLPNLLTQVVLKKIMDKRQTGKRTDQQKRKMTEKKKKKKEIHTEGPTDRRIDI